jgi:hypothetical protein
MLKLEKSDFGDFQMRRLILEEATVGIIGGVAGSYQRGRRHCGLR